MKADPESPNLRSCPWGGELMGSLWGQALTNQEGPSRGAPRAEKWGGWKDRWGMKRGEGEAAAAAYDLALEKAKSPSSTFRGTGYEEP